MAVTGASVAAFLDKTGDAATVAHADKVIPVVTVMVRAYVRGGDGWTANSELEAVITTATARLMANTGQIPVDQTTLDFSQSLRGAFTGWTTAELFVLNRYRQRAA